MTQSSTLEPSIWNKLKKIFEIVGFAAGIAAIIGVYYQFQNKESEVQFVVLSNDLLTVKNNVEGLESNYHYAGEPVKNLWLMKFKVINSGEKTLVGTNKSSDLLDSVLTFNFSKSIQILDNISLLNNNFPDHKLTKRGPTAIDLSFQQWRPNETATYSIYLKSDLSNPHFLPKTSRLLKDGNIIVDDLTNSARKIKQPLLDSKFLPSFSVLCRILGIILAVLLTLTADFIFLGLTLPQWFRYRLWKMKNKRNFRNFISNFDASNLIANRYKEDFMLNKANYLKDPGSLTIYPVWQKWESDGFEKMPETGSTPTTWKYFLTVVFITIIFNIATFGIVMGLWLD